jgi:lysyl-tRNA synthetase class 2
VPAGSKLAKSVDMIIASIFSDFWNDLVDHDEQGLFLVLVGFVLSFAFIRMSTRLMRRPKVPWWPGSIVSDSGVHLHHLVFGIVTMMIGSTLGFAALGHSPYVEICALVFGIGAGLTIDEFALWVYLDDVYWAEEGHVDRRDRDRGGRDRARPDRVLAVQLQHQQPCRDPRQHPQRPDRLCPGGGLLRQAPTASRNGWVLRLSDCRLWSLADRQPGSAWARRRYGERRPHKQTKAEARFPADRRTERFKNAFRDLVGGKPSEGIAAAGDEAVAATREATAEIRQRAEHLAGAADPTRRDG